MDTNTNTNTNVENVEIAPAITVDKVKFDRIATVTVIVAESNLADLLANLPEGSFDSEAIDYRSPNKGHQIVAIFKGMHADEIEFAERKEIAKAVNASPAMVSTILTDAHKKGTDWAVSYIEKDREQGELAAAKRKVAELDALIAKHPELAEIFAARFAASQTDSESAA